MILYCRASNIAFAAEVLPGDFLERQKAVPVSAIVNEGGLEAGLDSRDLRFIYVGFLLFSGLVLYVEVDQFLAINDGDTQLLFVSCVDEHSFHERSSNGGRLQWLQPDTRSRSQRWRILDPGRGLVSGIAQSMPGAWC